MLMVKNADFGQIFFLERYIDFYPNKVRRLGDAGAAIRSFSSPIRAKWSPAKCCRARR
jgi:hypothetical protein